MGGGSSQRLKGTVHVFLPCLQAGRPGHLCLAVDPQVLPAGVEARQAQTGAATQGPRPTCTPLWPCAPPPKLAEAAKQGASLGAGTIPPVVIPQARAAQGESGVLHSFPFCRLVGMHRRDCSRPLTLYGPPSRSLKPSAPRFLRHPTQLRCPCLPGLEGHPEQTRTMGPRPKAWAAEAHLSPEKEGRVFRPSNCVCLFLSQLGGGTLSAALGAWWGACEVHGVSLGSWTILAQQPLNGADL